VFQAFETFATKLPKCIKKETSLTIIAKELVEPDSVVAADVSPIVESATIGDAGTVVSGGLVGQLHSLLPHLSTSFSDILESRSTEDV